MDCLYRKMNIDQEEESSDRHPGSMALKILFEFEYISAELKKTTEKDSAIRGLEREIRAGSDMRPGGPLPPPPVAGLRFCRHLFRRSIADESCILGAF